MKKITPITAKLPENEIIIGENTSLFEHGTMGYIDNFERDKQDITRVRR
jgi:hypothetical protein